MSSKKLELEIRGKLDQVAYKRLLKFFDQNAKLKKAFTRFQMLYFSIHNENLKSHKNIKNDLRLRIENGELTLILKHGTWHKPAGREEYIIPLPKEKFLDTVKVLHHLGNDFGKIMLQETKVYEYEGIEWAIVKAPHKDVKYIRYYWEAEIEVSKNKEESALKQLNRAAEDMELSVFSQDEFLSFLESFNKMPGRTFDFREKCTPERIVGNFREYMEK